MLTLALECIHIYSFNIPLDALLEEQKAMESLTRGRLLIAELCFRLISRVVLFLKNTVITGLEPPQNKHETIPFWP